ncbi:MAG: hypothetical protein FD123_1012 [Bacteroidetes bacterium]|nr:MAG: hypothetical protein FD123_1012 [Bacteroidota bacterium]
MKNYFCRRAIPVGLGFVLLSGSCSNGATVSQIGASKPEYHSKKIKKQARQIKLVSARQKKKAFPGW